MTNKILIDAKRFESEFFEISKFGALKGGGLTRLAFSQADIKAREYLISLLKDEGLSVRVDSVGNIFARLNPQNPQFLNKPPVSIGSHIDSVPKGGIYDGTLGVMAGLAAIRAIKHSKAELARALELIVFVCEESSRFKMATIGSKIVSGKLSLSQIKSLKDENGISVYEAMKQAGFKPDEIKSAKLAKGAQKAYLELHIEQGPVLERLGINLGIVSAIAAPARYELEIKGRSDHSGATPMNMRNDALLTASKIAVCVNELACKQKSAVATIGYIHASPGVLNVIPGHARMGLDVRDIKEQSLKALCEQILKNAKEICDKNGCELEIKSLGSDKPVPLSKELIKLLDKLAKDMGQAAHILPSGAGHDAMHMKAVADSVGMIFVPCFNGISHNKAENIDFNWAILGATLLANSAYELAKE